MCMYPFCYTAGVHLCPAGSVSGVKCMYSFSHPVGILFALQENILVHLHSCLPHCSTYILAHPAGPYPCAHPTGTYPCPPCRTISLPSTEPYPFLPCRTTSLPPCRNILSHCRIISLPNLQDHILAHPAGPYPCHTAGSHPCPTYKIISLPTLQDHIIAHPAGPYPCLSCRIPFWLCGTLLMPSACYLTFISPEKCFNKSFIIRRDTCSIL